MVFLLRRTVDPRVSVPLFEFCAIMPIINTLSSLPISVGGVGVREGLFQTLLNTLCDVKKGDAVVISLLGFAMVLFWAICGGIINLFYRPLGARKAGRHEAGSSYPESTIEIAEAE